MYYIEFALNFLIKFCMKKNIITGLVLLVWGSVFYSCTSEKTVQADFDIIPLPQHVEKSHRIRVLN